MPKSPMTDVNEEIHAAMRQLDARAHLLADARDHFKYYMRLRGQASPEERGRELDKTLERMLEILGMIQRSDESIMQIRHECQAMIAQASRALELDALARPLIVQLEPVADGQARCGCEHTRDAHKNGVGQCTVVQGFVQCRCRTFRE